MDQKSADEVKKVMAVIKAENVRNIVEAGEVASHHSHEGRKNLDQMLQGLADSVRKVSSSPAVLGTTDKTGGGGSCLGLDAGDIPSLVILGELTSLVTSEDLNLM